MNRFLPLIAFAAAALWGLTVKIRMRRQVMILSAAYEFACQVRYALSGSCMSTVEILRQAERSAVGTALPCLKAALDALENGDDLYDAWEREVTVFCRSNRVADSDAGLLRKIVCALGSLDLLGSCAVYEELTDALAKSREKAEERNRTQGTAAVKIGLLCGLGLALLLWQP